MIKDTDSKQRILTSALAEFSKHGYGGARVDRIAKNAKINKAMIFYYFSSKKLLYHEILREVFSRILQPISFIINSDITAAEFLEVFPKVHINFLKNNLNFLQMITVDLIQNPKNIGDFFKDFMYNHFNEGPGMLKNKLETWYKEGTITETDPVQFMMNVVSLNIFAFIGRPIFEGIFQVNLDDNENFWEDRITSVTNTLKRGMLK